MQLGPEYYKDVFFIKDEFMGTLAMFFFVKTESGIMDFPATDHDFNTLYNKHLKEYLERSPKFTEKKFADFELRKVERMIAATDLRAHDYDIYSDMLETYKQLLAKKQKIKTLPSKKKPGPKPRGVEDRKISDIIADKYKNKPNFTNQFFATLLNDEVKAIDKNFHWLGKPKMLAAVWFLAATQTEFEFIDFKEPAIASEILNNTFDGLKISSDLYSRAPGTNTEKKYLPIFRRLFAAIR